MGQVYSIVPGLPGCQKTEGKETKGSIGLRITAVALGALVATVGILALAQVPGLSLIGTAGGATALSLGVVLAAASLSIKRIKKEESQPESQESSEIVEEETKKTSGSPSKAKSQIPEEVAEKLPRALSGYFDEIPYLQLSGGSDPFVSMEKTPAPMTLFSDENVVGFHLKLRAQYQPMEGSSSEDPFSFQAIAWKKNVNDDFWLITSKDNQWIQHKDKPFSAFHILGNNLFKFWDNDQLLPRVTKILIGTEKQDKLPDKYRFNLAWILLRLIKSDHFLLRERTLSNSFYELADGHWRISLDQ